MKVYGDIEQVNLSTGERYQRVTGDGQSVLVKLAATSWQEKAVERERTEKRRACRRCSNLA